MTAYEELKAWCEKHLEVDDYKAIPESENYCATIYFEPLINDNNIPCFVFDRDGTFQHSDVCTNDEMVEHIEDYDKEQDEEEIEPPHYSPPPNSIGGQMVRRMIEMYERQAH